MIVDLVDKLIDRCIQLLKRQEEVKSDLFTNFVAPTQEAFEAVHKDYLDTLRRYRALIKDVNHKLDTQHPVFDAMKEDSLFSAGLRSKLLALTEPRTDSALGSFVVSIQRYLIGIPDVSIEDPYWSRYNNVRRGNAAEELYAIIESSRSWREENEERKREMCLRALDNTVEQLQERYAREIRQFESLKIALLTPLQSRWRSSSEPSPTDNG